MTFPLAEKLAISHYISPDRAHQGQSDGRLYCFGRPTGVAQCQHPRCLLTNWPNHQALMALCIGLPITRQTASSQFTETNGATKSTHTIPYFQRLHGQISLSNAMMHAHEAL